jgi:hypothetical protein
MGVLALDVLEEGTDFPACNLVILFDFQQGISPRDLISSRLEKDIHTQSSQLKFLGDAVLGLVGRVILHWAQGLSRWTGQHHQ